MLCPRFWLTLAEFKRVYPLDKPIRVKYMVKTKNWASHQETENYHYFWFDRHTPVRMQIELLIHEYAQTAYSYTRQISNVHIEIPKSFSALVEIRDHLFAVEHGDGVKSWNGIPFYGLERKSRRLAAIYSRKEKDIDYYVYGHFHQPSTIPATHNSETIINGSWKATDPYIFHEHGGVIEPSQWLHTKQGISWRYRIRLRSADEKQGPKRYKIEMPN